MADSAIDFYGGTPSYSQNYLRLNSRRTNDSDISKNRVYSTGLIFADYNYYVGLTGGDSDYNPDDYLRTDPPQNNTLISGNSAGFNSGANGSVDSKYFINVGDGNNISAVKTSLVVGNNNTIDRETENVIILGGNNNEIQAGITQSVIINGDSAKLTLSNTTVIGGINALTAKPIQNIIHIVESKVSPYNLHSIFNVVDGGVRPIYIKSTTNIIQSGISVYS